MATTAAPDLVQTRRTGTTIEIVVTGEIDIPTAPALTAQISRALRRSPATLLVDLREVGFIDSCGVHLLTEAHHRAVAGRTRLVVLRPAGFRGRVFTLCGADELFPPHHEAADGFVSDWSL
ncbi:MAG: Anti-sigma factor antagonist (spoIIAA-2) Anti-sigma factor antagonist RsbV [Solirubrobacterales bacterium]|nr:Anti-sigma factor antagonist (spoIIAA-2) Anti-sigma factor antagonist RsbV [Solirubrobacterales bacterium]